MVWYAEADHDAFATTHAQEEEYATDLAAAYKLTIQDKNPDEFKELVLETYTAHSQASVQHLDGKNVF